MVGQIALMQGPLGVAASARRVQPRPDADSVESTIEARSAGLDRTPSRPGSPPSPAPENQPADQSVIESVAPQTLFEASRIAALLPPDSDAPYIPAQPSREPWQPPYSSFHLRDRTI